jgi:hypothetical protein
LIATAAAIAEAVLAEPVVERRNDLVGRIAAESLRGRLYVERRRETSFYEPIADPGGQDIDVVVFAQRSILPRRQIDSEDLAHLLPGPIEPAKFLCRFLPLSLKPRIFDSLQFCCTHPASGVKPRHLGSIRIAIGSISVSYDRERDSPRPYSPLWSWRRS